MKVLSVLAAALLVSAMGQCQAETWKEALLENDLLAAVSWALFDRDPYTMLGHTNDTHLDHNEIHEDAVSKEMPNGRGSQASDKDYDDDYYYFDYDTRSNGTQQNRQLLNFQGLRPKLKCEIRFLKVKLFEIYDKTYFSMFLGTGANGYLDDIFRLRGRGSEGSFLSSLEDVVSLIGVDGPACVHRLLCEMAAAPMFQTNGLFGELLDLTIRHILTTAYADAPSNSIDGSTDEQDYSRGRQTSADSRSDSDSDSNTNSDSSSDSSSEGQSSRSTPISYLDAVAAGRHGANCAHTFDTCPVSLLEITKFINDQSL